MKRLQHTGTFVIQFRSGTDLAAGPVAGRVEHVASTRSACFDSLDELLAFLTDALRGNFEEQDAVLFRSQVDTKEHS
jgi:hypothetical protein